MAKQRIGRGGGRRDDDSPSLLTRAVNSIFAFVKLAEFEILFILFFLIAFIIFKDLVRFLSFVLSLACKV